MRHTSLMENWHPCVAIDPVNARSTRRRCRVPESPLAAGTILGMPKDRSAMSNDGKQRPALPKDQSRLEMMAREKRMTLEQRVELFERLSRDAAWARSAKRVR